MKKLINFIKKILYALPFGMRAADDLLTTSNTDVDSDSGIHKKIERKSLWDSLLKGELTQEVEELRYKTFKAEELSNEYQYIGSGKAIRRDGDEATIKNKRKKFTQENVFQEYGVSESLIMMENEKDSAKDDWSSRSIFKIRYENSCVRFKLENYVYKIRVDMSNGTYMTYFYFVDDSYNRKVRPLVNFIKKTLSEVNDINEGRRNVSIGAYKSKNELFSEMKSLSFTTINATNDVPNGIDYNFKNPQLVDITEDSDGYMVLAYKWNDFDGNILLSEKFKSESQEKKYQNKEKKKDYKPVLDFGQNKEKIIPRDRNEDNLDSWLEEENIKFEE